MRMRLSFFTSAVLLLTQCKGAAMRGEASDLMAEEIALDAAYSKVCGGVASVYVQNDASTSLGTAFAIDKRGYFVTNSHVVGNAKNVVLELNADCTNGGGRLSAVVIANAEFSDVALLRVQGKMSRFTVLETGNQTEVRVGHKIFVIGNPHGFSNTLTQGIIANKIETLPIGNSKLGPVFQLGASINFGNSGGPLFNADGKVIGLVTAKHADAQSMGFALYIGKARAELASNLRYQRLKGKPQAFEGMTLNDVNLYGASKLVVGTVTPNSAASGFATDDVVMGHLGNAMDDSLDYEIFMREATPNLEYSMQVVRDGQQLAIPFMPIQRDDVSNRNVGNPR